MSTPHVTLRREKNASLSRLSCPEFIPYLIRSDTFKTTSDILVEPSLLTLDDHDSLENLISKYASIQDTISSVRDEVTRLKRESYSLSRMLLVAQHGLSNVPGGEVAASPDEMELDQLKSVDALEREAEAAERLEREKTVSLMELVRESEQSILPSDPFAPPAPRSSPSRRKDRSVSRNVRPAPAPALSQSQAPVPRVRRGRVQEEEILDVDDDSGENTQYDSSVADASPPLDPTEEKNSTLSPVAPAPPTVAVAITEPEPFVLDQVTQERMEEVDRMLNAMRGLTYQGEREGDDEFDDTLVSVSADYDDDATESVSETSGGEGGGGKRKRWKTVAPRGRGRGRKGRRRRRKRNRNRRPHTMASRRPFHGSVL